MKKGFLNKIGAKRAIVIVAAVALIFGSVIGGTIAWLTASTKTISNTFTVGGIGLSLEEKSGEANSYKYTLSANDKAGITKDPKVTVTKESVDCYVFVKVTASTNLKNVLTYEIADGWTKLDGVTLGEGETVYYRTVEGDTAKGVAMDILKDNKVYPTDEFTGDLSADFTLSFKAYAIQLSEFETNVTGAWGMVKDLG